MSVIDICSLAFPFVMAGLLTAGAFWLTARDQRERAGQKKTEA